jgi:hypothetical protein
MLRITTNFKSSNLARLTILVWRAHLHVSTALSLLYCAVVNSSSRSEHSNDDDCSQKKKYSVPNKILLERLGDVTAIFFCVGCYTEKQRVLLRHYYVTLFPQRTRGWHVASPSSCSCVPPQSPALANTATSATPALRISWLTGSQSSGNSCSS